MRPLPGSSLIISRALRDLGEHRARQRRCLVAGVEAERGRRHRREARRWDPLHARAAAGRLWRRLGVGRGEPPVQRGRRGGEREHDRREHSEVVVEVTRLGEVPRLEGHLEAMATRGVVRERRRGEAWCVRVGRLLA